MTSLSNMPRVKVEKREGGWEADVYQTSMKMSTYLVAFVIGNFVGKTSGKIGVWSPKGIQKSRDFALKASVKLLKFYEDTLQIKYDAPKLDMVAVPSHIAAAMENWGLIIYMQDYLLMKGEKDEQQWQKRKIAKVIAHEAAHQWFGNLVTMEWWSDIWLNEGLTTYMENLGFKHSFPELAQLEEAELTTSSFAFFECCSYITHRRISTRSYTNEPKWSYLRTLASEESSYGYKLLSEYCYDRTVSGATHFSAAVFQNDILPPKVVSKYFAKLLTHGSTTLKQKLSNFCSRVRINSGTTFFSVDCQRKPVSKTTVKKNVSVSAVDTSIFDQFVYTKGSIIVAMVHQILGEELFWKFIRVYLKEKAYGNVDENDFWRYVARAHFFTKSPKIDINKMKSWTHYPGMPVVTVTRDYSRRKAKLSQRSCISEDKHVSDLWAIPIPYITQTSSCRKPVIREWLTGKSVTLRNLPAEDQWILLNNEGVYYYIVDYDQHNWKLLINQLKQNHLVFTARQRYKVLADAHHLYLMKPDSVTNELLLDLYSYLHNENSWLVFNEPNRFFLFSALPLMIDSTVRELWKEYFVHIFGHVYDKFVDDESHRSPVPMTILEPAMCFFEYAPCVRKRMAEFQEWKNQTEIIPIDDILQFKEMLCVAARQSSENAWFLYEVFEKNTKYIYLEALLCSSNDSLINRLMDRFAEKNPWVLLDHATSLVTNSKHWPKIFDHIEKHFQFFVNKYVHRISYFFYHGSSPVFIEKVIQFSKEHLPRLHQEENKEMFRLIIKDREESLKKFKPIVSSIEEWLKRKSWVPRTD